MQLGGMEEVANPPSKNPEIEEGAGEEPTAYWPILNFDAFPRRQYHVHHQFQSNLGNSSQTNNFLKGLKWSPDGSFFLTSSDDNTLRRFDLPNDAAEESEEVHLADFSADSLTSSLVIQEGEAVYDFTWYPKMVVSEPDSCVFATTSRDHPIHLWDALTGELRCTYRPFDALDEITAAYATCFNTDGTRIYSGHKKMIRVFDTTRPGREFTERSTLTSNKDGQTGIISCLAYSPCGDQLLAAGSYSQTTALYSGDNLEMVLVLHGQQGGVTQVMFSKDGNYLYTGARKDPDILCWDIRNTVGTVYKLQRVTASTNQRITFDIEPNGRYLGTGGQDGLVHIYDLQTGDWVNSFQAAQDTVNSCGFHPYLPLGASSSGHRRFPLAVDADGTDEEEDGRSEEDTITQSKLQADENCASVWRFACSWVSSQNQPV